MTKTNDTLAYERGINDAIAAIRLGLNDQSAGADMRKVYDGVLATAEHRVRQLLKPAIQGK